MTQAPYNPLDKRNLARSIEAELLSRPCLPLSDIGDVRGAGIYAIYYCGDYAPYGVLRGKNGIDCVEPIYVGKAIPKGGRKGGLQEGNLQDSRALHSRLKKHAASIMSCSNLGIDDFRYRYVALDDIWIPLGENILIERFRPLWNLAIDGFGNNDPGRGRSAQKRSAWDVLHPGRDYAARLTGGGPAEAVVLGRVEDHFMGRKLRPLPIGVASPKEESAEED